MIEIFTSDEILTNKVLEIINLAIFSGFIYIDTLLMVLQGCVRALGIQRYAAAATILSYYLVTIPFTFILAFTELIPALSETINALLTSIYAGIFI